MRLSGRLQLSPTPRLIKQLGMVERFAGEWVHIGTVGVFQTELEREAAQAGAEAALALDATCPPFSNFLITVSNELRNGAEEELSLSQPLKQYLSAYRPPLTLNQEGLFRLYSESVLPQSTSNGQATTFRPWRTEIEHFRAPIEKSSSEELIFPTVSPFLVEQRLTELLSWANSEIHQGQCHPLLVAPLFHLLFLQIHPFPKGNHRLSLAILWHLLAENGYPFLRFQHVTPLFRERSRAYFAALKQAEKTAGTTWATCNIWFEFFFECLIETTRNLRELSETLLDESRLSMVQKRIIDVVRSRGTASRELIAQETGIHVSTIKYNLSLLAERGHLKRDGGGRSTHYRVG